MLENGSVISGNEYDIKCGLGDLLGKPSDTALNNIQISGTVSLIGTTTYIKDKSTKTEEEDKDIEIGFKNFAVSVTKASFSKSGDIYKKIEEQCRKFKASHVVGYNLCELESKDGEIQLSNGLEIKDEPTWSGDA